MKSEKSILNLKSLKEQVYDYLRKQMQIGKIKPGSVINMDAHSRVLGVSKTPLRDALIQLEMEGFVSILPRRGVVVNVLSVEDIKNYYQVIGALESTAVLGASAVMNRTCIEEMEKLNKKMRVSLEKNNFGSYYENNLKLHDVYIGLCGNEVLRRSVDTLKKRLYDFPRRSKFVKEWEESSVIEHQKLISLLCSGKITDAANFIRDVHWSFKVQEKYIKKYYDLDA
jgi:DNA-binding GntR family transcriptional regulator